MARTAGDIALLEQVLLRDIGVIVRFGPSVVEVLAPPDEVIDRALRSVGIEDLEPEAECPQRGLDGGQSCRGRRRQDRVPVPVSVGPLADEVVLSGVAQVNYEIGDRLIEVDETVREGMMVEHRMCSGARRRQRRGKSANEHPLHHAVPPRRGGHLAHGPVVVASRYDLLRG